MLVYEVKEVVNTTVRSTKRNNDGGSAVMYDGQVSGGARLGMLPARVMTIESISFGRRTFVDASGAR